jgi:hypothetical protein
MLIGYILISISAISLFGLSVITSFHQGSFFLFIAILWVFFLISLKIVIQFKKIRCTVFDIFVNRDFKIILFVLIGAVLSYVLNVYLGLGAIVAASLVGLIVAILIPGQAVSIYCGSFVGMVSPLVLHDFYHVIIAALIAGIVLMLSENVYKGYGGKLGAIAFISWIIVSFFSNVQLTNPKVLDSSSMLEIVVYSTAASYATFILSRKLKHDVVTSSSLVSLIAGLILPAIHLEQGGMFAAVAMSATFAGMSSKAIIKNDIQKILVSILVGLMFLYSYSHFGGAGGKLGTIAFGSVLAFKGFDVLIPRFQKQ